MFSVYLRVYTLQWSRVFHLPVLLKNLVCPALSIPVNMPIVQPSLTPSVVLTTVEAVMRGSLINKEMKSPVVAVSFMIDYEHINSIRLIYAKSIRIPFSSLFQLGTAMLNKT